MARTENKQRRIDVRLPDTGGGAIIGGTGTAGAGPGVPVPGAPRDLRVTSGPFLYAVGNAAPQAGVNLAWSPPVGTVAPDAYAVQWATTAGFTSPVTRYADRGQLSIGLDGMPVATTIYARVAARVGGVEGDWSASISFATPSDTTPPAPPTGLTTSWSGLTGDLEIRWTNPTSANLRDVRVRIYSSNGGTLLREVYSTSGRYVWSRAQHYADTSGVYDPSVYLVLTARSLGGTLSTTDLTGTATLAVPATPAGLTSTWAGDTGTAAASCVITWTVSGAVALYRLSIDGAAREVVGGRYAYDLTTNASEHGGTPDPALSLSLVAVDALGQTSAAATQTATNAAPPATTISVFGAFSTVGLTIGQSAAADIKDYRVRVYRGGTLVRTVFFTDLRPTYAVEDGDGSYTFDVAARDVFGQIGAASAQTAPAALTDLAGFVTTLRSGLVYSDNYNTSRAQLAGLKDGTLTTDVVTYAASASWAWVQADWQEEITTQTTELVTSAPTSMYIGYSLDGTSWTYYYGTTPAGGRWQPVSFTATEATAQAGAGSIPAGTWRVDIPAPRRARYIRIYHRNAGAVVSFREFFPATLLRATYMQAESVTAVNLAAGAVLADNLAAGAIDGFTITGATIRTNSTNTRIEMSGTDFRVINSGVTRVQIGTDGLKTFDSQGNVQVEATTATDGALKAGAGAVTLDKGGFQIAMPASNAQAPNKLRWTSGADAPVEIAAWKPAGAFPWQTRWRALGTASEGRTILEILAEQQGGNATFGQLRLEALGGTHGSAVLAAGGTSTTRISLGSQVSITGDVVAFNDATVQGGLSVGDAAGAANGSVYSDGSLAGYYFWDRTGSGVTPPAWAWFATGGIARLWHNSVGDRIQLTTFGMGVSMAPDPNVGLFVQGNGASTATWALAARNGSSQPTFNVNDAGQGWFAGSVTAAGVLLTSDARTKDRIAPIADALATLRAIPARQWERRGEAGGRRHYGPVAQDAQAVDAALVVALAPGPGEPAPADAPLLALDYSALVGLIHGAVQQLDARLAALEQRTPPRQP